MRRLLLAAAIGCLAPATPAIASSTIPPAVHFDQGPGVLAKVTVYSGGDALRMDVVRQGQVLGQASWSGGRGGTVVVPSLSAGDVANLYSHNGTPLFSATYDGTPVIEGACAGRSSFTFSRPSLRHQWRAGVLTPLDYPRDSSTLLGSEERTDGPLTIPVTLARPLALGDYAYAATRALVLPAGPVVLTTRINVVEPCPVSKPVARPKLAAAARALRRGTLGRAKQIKLPMTYSEPGTYRVRIVARGGRTIADGRRTRALAGQANVTLTVKRRALARRATRVTLRATFTPARTGVKARSASTALRLRQL